MPKIKPIKFPESIDVCGIPYRVVTMDLLGQAYGRCNYPRQQIELEQTNPRERQLKTLSHELLHALFYESGLQHLNTERNVNQLEGPVLALLQKNKWDWLNKEAR